MPHQIDLADEPRDVPAGRIVRLVAATAAELVVEDHRPLVGEGVERFQVVVPRARSAVQNQQRRALAAAHPPVPDAVPVLDLDRPFTAGSHGRQGRHSRPLPKVPPSAADWGVSGVQVREGS